MVSNFKFLKVTFKEMKESFDIAIGMVDLVVTNKSPFAKALQLAQERAPSDPASNTPAALEATARAWSKAGAPLRTKVNKVTMEAFLEVKDKFAKVCFRNCRANFVLLIF